MPTYACRCLVPSNPLLRRRPHAAVISGCHRTNTALVDAGAHRSPPDRSDGHAVPLSWSSQAIRCGVELSSASTRRERDIARIRRRSGERDDPAAAGAGRSCRIVHVMYRSWPGCADPRGGFGRILTYSEDAQRNRTTSVAGNDACSGPPTMSAPAEPPTGEHRAVTASRNRRTRSSSSSRGPAAAPEPDRSHGRTRSCPEPGPRTDRAANN